MEYSFNEHIKQLVSREFPNYIPVPSLADSSMFNILNICIPDTSKKEVNMIKKQIKRCINIFSAANDPPNFTSLGHLFDYCSDTLTDHVHGKKDPVCIHSKVSGWNGKIQGNSRYSIEGEAFASHGNKNGLDFGKIEKISLSYKEVSGLISKITNENAPDLCKEARKSHLYVIFDVLLAERLEVGNQDNSMIECGAGVSGTAGASGNLQCFEGYRLSRPKSMGRYPFAFKCGRIRYSQRKKRFGLVGPKEFYSKLLGRQQNDSPDQSQSPKHCLGEDSLDNLSNH